jgi:hypothetical protein
MEANYADRQNLELITKFRMGESVVKQDKDNCIELQTISDLKDNRPMKYIRN